MKHKIITILIGVALVILLIYVLGFKKGGTAIGVKKHLPSGDIYTSEEMDAAAEVIIRYFEENFDRCRLTYISWEQEFYGKSAAEVAKNEDVEEALTFGTNFKTAWMHGNLSLRSFSTCSWEWILIRNEDGEWEIADNMLHGYGAHY